MELREQFTLAPGVSQSMTGFKSKALRESPTSSVSGDTRNGSMQGPITKVGLAEFSTKESLNLTPGGEDDCG